MENSYYASALKAGQKYYRQHLLDGTSPYLKVLDEQLPNMKSYTGIDLGLVNVPIDRVVGTLTKGRSDSFAGNFMPLAKEGTEFANKWKSLAESHEKEGIREPVLLYEYMNRYYVQEGNKRVSVLKFFGAVNIHATVRRILPDKTSDPKVIAYFAYLDFNKSTGINFLEFSKAKDYPEFVTLMGKVPGEKWSEEEVKKLQGLYYRFSRALAAQGGEKLQIETGDALLACLRIYSFSYVHGLAESELKKVISRMWDEIRLQEEKPKIEVKLEPDEKEPSQTKKVLNRILGPKVLKAAFIYQRERKGSSWVFYHELGRHQVEKNLEGKVETADYYCENEFEVEPVLRAAICEGADVIFATSAEMLPACLKVAVEEPNVAILNCTLNKPHRYVRVYYPRMYEAKLITGAIAGVLCENDKIGYICKYPVYGSIAELNAFARGVQMTNPKAKIYLEWCSLPGGVDAPKRLMEQGIELISMRDYQEDQGIRHIYGLEQVVDGVLTPIVVPIWNWGVYYERILNSMLNGTYKTEHEKTRKSLNYYWGMSSDVIGLLYAERLPDSVRYLGELLKRTIAEGICKPFSAPEKDANGKIQWETIEQTLSVEDILEMDYLEDNIVGRIPAYEEMSPQAQRLVDEIGISCAKKAGTRAVTGVNADINKEIGSVETGNVIIVEEEET